MTSPITPGLDGSFDSVAFMEIYPSGRAVEHDSGISFALTPIPGGNKYTIDVAGANPDRLDLTIAVTGTSLTSLRSKAKNSVRGSLVYHAGTTNARLVNVKGVSKQQRADAYLATLELILG